MMTEEMTNDGLNVVTKRDGRPMLCRTVQVEERLEEKR
jgi:hypothetical protein